MDRQLNVRHYAVIDDTAVGAIRISEDDILALGKDPKDSVRWPAKYGGGYIGFVESLHMLHCLDFVRKMTFRPEYYGDDAYFQEAEFGIRRHAGKNFDHPDVCLMRAEES